MTDLLRAAAGQPQSYDRPSVSVLPLTMAGPLAPERMR